MKLLGTSGNRVSLGNVAPSIMFRRGHLLPFGAIVRGVRLINNSARGTTRFLGTLNVRRATSLGPTGLSKNVGQHTTVTETLTIPFSLLVLSRPFGNVSGGGLRSATDLVGRIYGGGAIVLVARSGSRTGLLRYGGVRVGG